MTPSDDMMRTAVVATRDILDNLAAVKGVKYADAINAMFLQSQLVMALNSIKLFDTMITELAGHALIRNGVVLSDLLGVSTEDMTRDVDLLMSRVAVLNGIDYPAVRKVPR